MFLRRVLLLSVLLHIYIGARLLPAFEGVALEGWLLSSLLIVSSVLAPAGLVAGRMPRKPWSDRLAWAGFLSLGLFSSLFVLTLVRDVGLALALVSMKILPDALPIDRLLQWSGLAVPVLAVAVTTWGFVNARRTARVVHVDIPIENLPASLHGFRFAQISDIHVGPTVKLAYVAAIVHAVNRLDADVVAITGDLVDGRVPQLAAHIAPLADLVSRHGTYFVTGNHEYYSGAHDEWIAELRRLGVRVLMNEHVVLQRGCATLVLAGVADFTAHHFEPSHRSDPKAAIQGAPNEAAVRVLLAHQPRTAPAAKHAGFDVQISGHTHGGQFWPWVHFVRMQQPFTAGLHRLEKLWIYTSRGTGYWGPPKRFGAPSEITALRLVCA